MTSNRTGAWSPAMRAIRSALAACLSLLSLFFLVIALYEFKLTGRVNLTPVFHAVICCVAALAYIKIKQHPARIADYEERIRRLFRK